MQVKQGTTLYLCLEDSQLHIQNRLFNVTEDAPANVHFCTESRILGDGLTEQLEQFLVEHPDTSLIIIDTLQMIRGTTYDNTYANDYRDLSVLKRLADAHGIVILLIHHLRKEKADDVFTRISGTTAISGAVDSSFTLVEEQRGSGRAKFSCIGRDIEYRELELRERTEFIGTPTELAKRIDPDGGEGITPKKVARQLLQSIDALGKAGITVSIRRSNGKRLIELRRADSADFSGVGKIDPIDPGAGKVAHCAAR